GLAAARSMPAARDWEKRDIAGAALLRLPDVAGAARCIVASTSAPEAGTEPAIPLDHWRWLEVQSGIPTIEAATIDRFVPQMINFELLGGVDFRKGCYPGQEVVARSEYRGTIKRRMFLFDCAAPAVAGQEVFHSADPGQPAGMVVNAAPGPAGAWSALVEVKLVALEGGTLHLGSSEGALLRIGELPYPLN
ncbi:MAG TPA: tRNA-modifying protein YgfZ, partial [Caldimonas sp.]